MFDDGITKVDPLQVVRGEGHRASLAGVLAEGSRFGAYVIGSCIGHGGMARIYRAEHEGLRRNVALKVLIDGFARDPEGRERFLREARIAAAIKHPNVVNIFDVGVQDEIPYLVMELLEGEDLEAMVNRRGALPEATLVDVVVPIVAGLAAVHDAGVVHRDLKPGNIFLAKGRNEEFEPKLLDFGISRAAESEKFKLTTARGLLMGTPLYMSPEAIQGAEITALSDQYSLGVVLYECCTGFNPFAADTLAETVRRVTTGDFAPPSQHNPALSRRLGRIIQRAMHLDPTQRFSDLREMGRELLLLAGQRTRITWSLSFGEHVGRRTGSLAVMSESLTAAAAGRSSTSSSARSRKLTSVAALIFGFAMFGAAGVLLWTRNPPAVPETSGQALQPVDDVTEPPGAAPAPREAIPANPPSGSAEAAPQRPAASDAVGATGEAPSERSGAAASSDDRPSRNATRSVTEVRPKRRAAAVAPRAPARSVALETAPPAEPESAPAAQPEWLEGGKPPAPPARSRSATRVGTNNAPIFD